MRLLYLSERDPLGDLRREPLALTGRDAHELLGDGVALQHLRVAPVAQSDFHRANVPFDKMNCIRLIFIVLKFYNIGRWRRW